MRIALVGYSGFLGRNLMVRRKEDQFIRVTREVLHGEMDRLCETLRDCKVIVNLAGAPILRRWSARGRRIIEESRRGINHKLVEAINRLEIKPQLFITASAIGIYPSEGIHDETARDKAAGYLSEVVTGWEEPLSSLHPEVGTATLRIGIVLGREGGIMAPYLKMARWGMIPIMGSGKQINSFIHISDMLRATDLILDKGLNGIFNLCSPYPVDNATFAKTVANVTDTKHLIGVPVWFLKLMLGNAHVMITEGQHVLPERLNKKGFKFNYALLEDALKNLVQKP